MWDLTLSEGAIEMVFVKRRETIRPVKPHLTSSHRLCLRQHRKAPNDHQVCLGDFLAMESEWVRQETMCCELLHVISVVLLSPRSAKQAYL